MKPTQMLKQLFTKSNVAAVGGALLLQTLMASHAFALSPSVQQLVTDETRANAIAKRSDQAVVIEHYEIPYRLVAHDVAARTPKNVLDSLLFQKNGETYIRWVINPEDTQWHLEVAQWLEQNGVKAEKFKYFTGYQTASRSYIVEDPVGHAQFSIKVSTNRTGGNWKNKKQEWVDVQQIRNMTDFIDARRRVQPAADIIILDEPAGFGIPSLDQGMVVRLLADLPSGNHKYVPGFSIMEESRGKAIALENGASDPADYWDKHYNQPLARGIAELAALAGITYDSPHSQNFLVELDRNDKPTGKIVLRDFGDVFLNKEFYEATGAMKIFDNWEEHNKHSGEIQAGVGILHGNTWPSWISEAQYVTWGQHFYTTFDQVMSHEIGAISSNFVLKAEARNGAYFLRAYDTNQPNWQSYFSAVKAGPARVTSLRCEALFN